MADRKTAPKPLAVEAKFSKTSEHRQIYVNASQTGISPWDIRFGFGQVTEGPPGTIDELVTLIMSPAHAKAFVGGAVEAIRMYEATFGPIGDPVAFAQASQLEAPVIASPKPKVPQTLESLPRFRRRRGPQ